MPPPRPRRGFHTVHGDTFSSLLHSHEAQKLSDVQLLNRLLQLQEEQPNNPQQPTEKEPDVGAATPEEEKLSEDAQQKRLKMRARRQRRRQAKRRAARQAKCLQTEMSDSEEGEMEWCDGADISVSVEAPPEASQGAPSNVPAVVVPPLFEGGRGGPSGVHLEGVRSAISSSGVSPRGRHPRKRKKKTRKAISEMSQEQAQKARERDHLRKKRKRERKRLERERQEEEARRLEREREEQLQREKEEKRQATLRRWEQQLPGIKKRAYIIKELLETERSYVDSLNLIFDLYADGFSRRGVKRAVIELIFSNIQPILDTSKCFLERLEAQAAPLQDIFSRPRDKVETWEWVALDRQLVIGSVFLETLQQFHEYSLYINTYEQSTAKVLELQKRSSKIARFLDEGQDDPRSQNLTLESQMIKPIQRIPRYQLFLTSLLKATDPSHEDYRDLVKALDNIRATAEECNEGRRSFEEQQRVSELEERFKLKRGNAPRKLLQEGTLMKVSERKRRLKPVQVYVFTDKVVLFREKMFSDLFFCFDLQDSTFEISQLSGSSKRFVLTQSRVHTVYLEATTPEECNEWYRIINQQAKAFRRRTI